MACLAPDTVNSLFADGVSSEARDRVDAHVDECPACRQLIVAMARERTRDGTAATVCSTSAGSNEQGPHHVVLTDGDRVGRYEIVRFIGAGAMGAVYEARDPELGRQVALKIVPAGDGASAESRANRLRREAQAMAQLSHPNIVPVFDAGRSDDRLFIAMQRIAGVSLREHLALTRPSRAERIRLVREAGRGLAAAHAAGIVHRDLKPDNVLVDAQGNALVVDFGLARLTAEPEPPQPASPSDRSTDDRWRTMEGVVVGTPAYMAPEVVSGGRGDALSDQYSFGVMLAEACGVPLGDERAITTLPRRLRRVVRRALSIDPRHRFPTMDALLAALAPPRATRLAILGVLAAVAAGLVIVMWPHQSDAVAACRRAADQHRDRVWSAQTRRELATHLQGLAAPGAASISETVLARLDHYATDWHRQRVEVCEAADVRGERSPGMRDIQTACLDDRLVELDVTRRMLQALSAQELASAPGLDVLGDLASCTDVRDLARDVPADPMLDGVARALRRELVEANASIVRGRIARAAGLPDLGRLAALHTAEAVRTSARAAHLPTIEAHALRVRSHLLDKTDDRRATGFYEALAIGDRLASHGIRIDALIGLLDGAVTDAARSGEVPLLVRLIEATLTDLPGAQDARRARLAALRTDYHRGRQELAEAETFARDAVARFEADRGRGDPFALNARRVLAALLRERGQLEEARQVDEELLTAVRATYGERHPFVVVALIERGTSLARAGQIAEARAAFTQALGLAEALHGSQHLQVAQVQRKLGYLELDVDARAARAWFARALAIVEPRGKPEAIAPLLVGAGEAALALGDAPTAVAELERGLALRLSPKDAQLEPPARAALARARELLGGDHRPAREASP